MSNTSSQSGGDDEWVKNSPLYREFLAEREEIMKHKWIESEKARHDIGFERDQRTNGITHKIDPDIDLERDFVEKTLTSTGIVSAAFTSPTTATTMFDPM